MSHINHMVLKTILETTRSADGPHSGTIVQKKKGDWMWWVGSVVILASIPLMPQWAPYVENVWSFISSSVS